jgi:RHS repeat-associated protein
VFLHTWADEGGWHSEEDDSHKSNWTIVGDDSSCGCTTDSGGSGTPGQAGFNNSTGPNSSVALGSAAAGATAGVLQLRATSPSAALSLPATLTLPFRASVPTGTLDVVTNGSGVIQQVKSPQVLVHVAVVNAYKYYLQVFNATNVTAKTGGYYGTNAAAFVTYTVENPDTSTATNRLNITEARPGVASRTFSYVHTNESGVKKWLMTDNQNLRTVASWSAQDSLDGSRTNEVTEIRSGSTVVQRSEKSYGMLGVGSTYYRVLKRSTEGSGSVTNTTLYYYNTDGVIQPERIVHSDGRWEHLVYDADKRVTQRFESYLDATPPALGTTPDPYTDHCKETDYSYSGVVDYDRDQVLPRMARMETVLLPYNTGAGWDVQEVSRTYRSAPEIDEVQEYVCAVPGASWNDAGNMLTRTVTYSDPADENSFGKTKWELRPDGTAAVYLYQTNSSGVLTNIQMLVGQPVLDGAGSPTNVLDGVRTDTMVNSVGKTLLLTRRAVVAGSLSITLARQTYTYTDDQLASYQVVDLAGRTNSVQYACCGLESSTDPDGVLTTYDLDNLKRQVARTVLRGGAWVKTTNILDAAGRVVATKRIGWDNSTVTLSQTLYDVLGRPTSETNALGGVTTLAYVVATTGTTTTTTDPSGGTRITTTYADGQTKSVSGTAAFPVNYAYGVLQDTEDSNWYAATTTVKVDSTGGTNEWETALQDGAGRTFKTLYAAASGPFPYSRVWFDAQGQLWKERDADGVIKLHTFNLKGEPEYNIDALSGTALAITDYGTLTNSLGTLKSGTDRITQQVHSYVTAAGAKPDLQRNDTYRWKDGSSTGVLVQRSEASADGLKSWNVVYPDGSTPVSTDAQTTVGTNRVQTQWAPDGSSVANSFAFGLPVKTIRYNTNSSPVSTTTFGYDYHGLRSTSADARNGTTTFTFNAADQVTSVTTPNPGTGAQVTTTFYDNMGRETGKSLPDGTTTTNQYHPSGLLAKTWGSRSYPVGYGYDAQGRMRYMTNWQTFASLSGSSVTRWNYHTYRGWLSSKDYPDATTGNPPGTAGTTGPNYTYKDSGRLGTRVWLRGVTTTYGYSAAGDLATVNYSGGSVTTPNVTNVYNRLGQLQSVARNGLTNWMTYNYLGQMLGDGYLSGTFSGLFVTNQYDGFLHRTNSGANRTSTVLARTQYQYDPAGRFLTVSSGTASATYSYVANSSLVDQLVFKQSGTTRLTTTKSHDLLNRLQSISSTASGSGAPTLPVAASYVYNQANQRTRKTEGDGSYWIYAYDALGQVTSGRRYWQDGTPVAGQQFDYAHDDIGNRTGTDAGGNSSGGGMRHAGYTANRLNQYTQRYVPGYADILGLANPTASVTVNGNSASRKGEYFHWPLAIANSSSPQYTSVSVVSTYGATQTSQGSVYLAATNEVMSYDSDGNLTADGRFNYTWDGENRVTRFERISGAPTASKVRVDLDYDSQSRRIQKIVSTNNGTIWFGVSTNRYLYDGWNLVAVVDHLNNLVQTFAWGSDLSGSQRGSGGVGGLLSMTVASGTLAGTYFYAHDGNGNVMAAVNAADGSVSARYDYGPFGETIRSSGSVAQANPFQFSTKFNDAETGLLYYGYRYYDQSAGRWLNRDPIEEQGGNNIYSACANNLADNCDILGLNATPVWPRPRIGFPNHDGVFWWRNPDGSRFYPAPRSNWKPSVPGGPIFTPPTPDIHPGGGAGAIADGAPIVLGWWQQGNRNDILERGQATCRKQRSAQGLGVLSCAMCCKITIYQVFSPGGALDASVGFTYRDGGGHLYLKPCKLLIESDASEPHLMPDYGGRLGQTHEFVYKDLF